MKYKFFIIILIFPILLISENYTLEELLRLALQNNTTLQQSNINLQMSQARRTSARVLLFPEVSGSIGTSENFASRDPEDNRHNAMSVDLSYAIALNYDAFFQNRNAQHDLNLAVITNEIQMQDIIYDIIQSYINVLENQMRLELQDENITIQESIVTESQQLFRQNRITQFEVQQSEINLLNARINALNASNNLTLSRNRLFDLINITDEGKGLAEVRLYENEPVENFSRQIDFNQILQVQQQNETAERYRTNINQTKLDFFPDIRLRYTYSYGLSSNDFSFDRENKTNTLGLNMSYSLNRLYRNKYSYQVANLLDEHHQLGTSRLLSDINLRYNQYLEELNYLQQLNGLQQNRVQQTTDNLDIAQQRYRLGLLTQLDLDRARYDYLNSRIDLEVNQYQLILKKLSIDHLLSNILSGVREFDLGLSN
ncbi:MAG: TolC family protein [Candidatus Cloacimonetes bacterium]|nr:TolC family protein [Candidatus Cloacimonadota bacterium]